MLIVLVPLFTVVILASMSERYGEYWYDAKAALWWDNPLCTDYAAFSGLRRARTVARRTDAILQASALLSEDAGGLYAYSTPDGEFWMPQDNDVWSLSVVLAEQEQAVYGNAGGLGVHTGDIVIDGGAHVGLFARAALAAGASKVVTFEVTPKSNEALRRNLAAEIAEGKVVVVEKGVWHEEGILPLVIVEGCSVCNSVSHPWLQATLDVPLTTIDRVVQELKLPRVDFIKLDIENAEANALRGATQTLAQYRPRLAVALENSKTRIAYGHEVVGVIQEAFAGYQYTCGVVTPEEQGHRVLPEILHFVARRPS